jgi:hypothetical protein
MGFEWLVVAVVAALGAIGGAFLRGKRKGRQEGAQAAREADNDRANEIRRKADDARSRGGDPVERLRDAGLWRDGD